MFVNICYTGAMKKPDTALNSRKIFTVLVAVFVLIAFGVILWISLGSALNSPATSIKSFEACTEAGYPIQQSFPEVCSVPGGGSFKNPAQ